MFSSCFPFFCRSEPNYSRFEGRPPKTQPNFMHILLLAPPNNKVKAQFKMPENPVVETTEITGVNWCTLGVSQGTKQLKFNLIEMPIASSYLAIEGSYFRNSRPRIFCIDSLNDIAALGVAIATARDWSNAICYVLFNPVSMEAQAIYDEAKRRNMIPIPNPKTVEQRNQLFMALYNINLSTNDELREYAPLKPYGEMQSYLRNSFASESILYLNYLTVAINCIPRDVLKIIVSYCLPEYFFQFEEGLINKQLTQLEIDPVDTPVKKLR